MEKYTREHAHGKDGNCVSEQSFSKFIIIQTAFPGDVILTLPLVQGLKRKFPASTIDLVAIPVAAELLRNHPDIGTLYVYDKRNTDRGINGFWRLAKKLRAQKFDAALIPHRSLRSALLAFVAGIPRRIGFDRSAGRFTFTDTVRYEYTLHEVERNLCLAQPFLDVRLPKELPNLFPSADEQRTVDAVLTQTFSNTKGKLIGIAPGSVWNTKRWLEERFSELIAMIVHHGDRVVLIGGKEDEALCSRILAAARSSNIFSLAGQLTFLQSAEAIRRCNVLVSNDSAPMHLAVAMRTPVVGIFGPTIPGFGFAPYGLLDKILGVSGLSCRPCTIHGSAQCPIRTHECMVGIDARRVYDAIQTIVENSQRR